MDSGALIRLVKSDLYRYAGSCDLRAFFTHIARSPGFEYTCWLRLVAWLRMQTTAVRILSPAAGLYKRHLSYKYGISIPASTSIGPGFYVGHFGGIVVNDECTIGRNCNISQGVTLGQVNRGANRGCPAIGDGVYIGPGAKIVGRIRIGRNVLIGANAVVTKDVPDNAVVGGIPAVVLSYEGAAGYVNRTDYADVVSD